jgi:metal-responsive CopG/Arc/MetJ family transcriptional regulator
MPRTKTDCLIAVRLPAAQLAELDKIAQRDHAGNRSHTIRAALTALTHADQTKAHTKERQ